MVKKQVLKKCKNLEKICILGVLFIYVTLFTGCWDKVEINDRGFIVGVGIDYDEDSEQILATYSVPYLPKLTGQTETGKERYLKETTGNSFFEASKKFGEKSEFRLNFDHTKVIILGEQITNNPKQLKGLLDHFERSAEFAQSLLIVSTKGSAKKLLTAKADSPDIVSMDISQTLSNSASEKIKISRMNLGDYITSMYTNDGMGFLPVMECIEEEILINGLRVFKEYKSRYILSINQMTPFGWIKGEGKGSIANFEYDGIKMQYEISENKKSIDVQKENNYLKITIELSMEGDIKEYILSDDMNDPEKVKEIEKKIKESMEEQSNEVIRIIQKEVGADLFEIGDSMKINNRKLWQEIEEDWNAYFSSAKIYVDIQPNIRRIGMSE